MAPNSVSQGIDKNDKYNGQNNAYNYGQCNCVSHAFLGCLCLALAQFQAQIRRTTVANHHGQCQRNDRNGKDDVGSSIAQIAHAPADEDLVHNVIQ